MSKTLLDEKIKTEIDPDNHDMYEKRLVEMSTMLLTLRSEDTITDATYNYMSEQIISVLHYLYSFFDKD